MRVCLNFFLYNILLFYHSSFVKFKPILLFYVAVFHDLILWAISFFFVLFSIFAILNMLCHSLFFISISIIISSCCFLSLLVWSLSSPSSSRFLNFAVNFDTVSVCVCLKIVIVPFAYKPKKEEENLAARRVKRVDGMVGARSVDKTNCSVL